MAVSGLARLTCHFVLCYSIVKFNFIIESQGTLHNLTRYDFGKEKQDNTMGKERISRYVYRLFRYFENERIVFHQNMKDDNLILSNLLVKHGKC